MVGGGGGGEGHEVGGHSSGGPVVCSSAGTAQRDHGKDEGQYTRGKVVVGGDKDMKLTDIRLEALSSAHQLEQLRETMAKMKVSTLGGMVCLGEGDKDMKLTDIRLEALSSAHQLEQLRETMAKMKVSILGGWCVWERGTRT